MKERPAVYIIATNYLNDLGGKNNIDTIVDCATRIRAFVFDESKVANDEQFITDGAINIVKRGKAIQIISGLNAAQILASLHNILEDMPEKGLDEYGLTQFGERAMVLYECFGLPENIIRVTVLNGAIMIQVKDPLWIDPFDIMLQLDIGILSVVHENKNTVLVYINHATEIGKELIKLIHKKRS